MTATRLPGLEVHGVSDRRERGAGGSRAAEAQQGADIGGKARGLVRIVEAGFRTAPWFVIPASARPDGAASVPAGLRRAIGEACRALELLGATAFAVRSSALDEDGATYSFAGQYATFLGVPDAPGVIEAVERCWASADLPTVRAYRTAVGVGADPPGIAVIVQAMVDATVSGVAFSARPGPAGDPGARVAGGEDDAGVAVVVATRGLGAPLVAGEVDGDEYHVDRSGHVAVARTDGGGPRCLDDCHVRAIAGVARSLASAEGVPQDVEWAIAPSGELVVLQARPITAGVAVARRSAPDATLDETAALGTRPLGAGGMAGTVRLWDNANIVESFSGITLPLTYSVAREAYAKVYRDACRALGVSATSLAANADVFDQMIGQVEGRVYYNVSSWHRVLAMLPGFGQNRAFLERMMGAPRPGGVTGERAGRVEASRMPVLDIARVAARAGIGLASFERRAGDFTDRIHRLEAESRAIDVESMSIDELLDHYDRLREAALAGWHVTIFNDLALMVVHGALRRAADDWLATDAEPLVNRLIRTEQALSVAPAADLRAMAAALRDRPDWRDLLDRSDDPMAALRDDRRLAGLDELFEAYLERWGDRCPSELQLDRPTFREAPGPLLSTVRALAAPIDAEPSGRQSRDASAGDRAPAWAELEAALKPVARPVRAARLRALRSLVEMTQYRLRWRESMRFARTEVFAVARRVFRAMDRRFVDARILDRPGDLYYLDIAEIRGAIRGTLPPVDLRVIAADRRMRFERFASLPGPLPRFETTGPVLLARRPAHDPTVGQGCAEPLRGPVDRVGCDRASGSTRTRGGRQHVAGRLVGTPVWGGAVRGACLPVEDPRDVVPRPGWIVAARSTDPGWVPLLLSVGGLLVERGSLLSHSAIVARELGIPTIVGISGLMAAVRSGATVDMDGTTGVVDLEPDDLRGPGAVPR